MLKYIIRLDDACPNMDQEKWDRMEQLLDKYNIKPIVGVIPDNKDEEFSYATIPNFWENYALKWQEKDWIIALHGLHHKYYLLKNVRTEYCGKPYQKQKEMLEEGYNILLDKGIKPTCFFAPNHTFDENTTKACRDLGYFDFISDGIAFYPYRKHNMLFLPNCFDTPHKISNDGVFTFVYHPNKMNNEKYKYLEEFIKKHRDNFDIDVNEFLQKYNNRKRSLRDIVLAIIIKILRFVRKG